MGHNILQRDIVIEGERSSRTSKGMEAMASWRDVEGSQDRPKGIPNLSVDDLVVGRTRLSKQWSMRG